MNYLNHKIILLLDFFFGLAFYSTGLNQLHAQEVSITASESARENELIIDSSVEYDLPYPGILPDHPLYFLKAIRDRIQSFFISDPIEKAEFNLLQADKRIQASFLLFQKGGDKIDLAQSTFSKAENYYENALGRLDDAKSQGVNVDDIAQRFANANKKHQEVIANIKEKLGESKREKFSIEQRRLMKFEQRVDNLIKQEVGK